MTDRSSFAWRRRWPPLGGVWRRYPLFLLAWFFWGLPGFWRIGNLVQDLRLFLYQSFGWEWI